MTVIENSQSEQFDIQRLGLFIAGAFFASFVMTMVLGNILDERNVVVLGGGLGVSFMLSLGMFWFARQGQDETAVYLFGGSILLSGLLLVLTLASSSGLLTVLVGNIVVLQTADLILSDDRKLRNITILLFVFSSFEVFLDLYPLIVRTNVPFIELAFILTTVFVLIFAFRLMQRQFQNYQFGRKLITLMTVLLFVSLTVIIVFGTSFTNRVLLDDLGQSVANSAEASAQTWGALLKEERDILQTVASDLEVAQLLLEEPVAAVPDERFIDVNLTAVTLRLYLAGLDNYQGFTLIDAVGVVYAATSAPEATLLANESWWNEAQALESGEILVGNLQEQELIDEEIFIPLITPIDVQGNRVGYLVGHYNLTGLTEQVNEPIQSGNVDYVVGSQALVFHSGHSELQEIDEEISNAVSSFEDSGNDYVLGLFESIPSVYSVVALPEEASLKFEGGDVWRAIAHESQEVVFSNLNQLRQLIILLGVGMSLGSMAIAFLVGRLLAMPLTHLAESAQQVADGDFHVVSDISSNDEIGVLSEKFNEMTHQMDKLLSGLEIEVSKQTHLLEMGVLVGRKLATSLDESALVKTAVEEIQAAFDYDYVSLLLLEEDGRFLNLVSGSGKIGMLLEKQGVRLSVNEGVVGRVVQRKTAVFLEDVAQEKAWLPNALLPGVRSEIAVPLLQNDEIVGVLDVQQQHGKDLMQEDVGILQALVNQLGVALQSARIYDQLQYQVRQETKLNRVNDKINATYHEAASLQVAVQELGKLIDVPTIQASLHLAAQASQSEGGS